MRYPTVSVLMPVYNGQRHVREALDSILEQSFEEFEFLIVDDGSTDATPDILAEYERSDPRVSIYRNKRNCGLTKTLIRGLGLVKGQYIARMDADDISLPDRFEKQVQYMNDHPDTGVLGTNIAYIDEDGELIGQGRPKHAEPRSPFMIGWTLLWKCNIYHPTVMMRREVLDRTGLCYRLEFEPAEDFDLWTRLRHHTVIDRLFDVGLLYRVVQTSISRVRQQEQRTLTRQISRREIVRCLEGCVLQTEGGLNTLTGIFARQAISPPVDYQTASDILFALYHKYLNMPHSYQDDQQLRHDVFVRQMMVANAACARAPVASLLIYLKISELSIGWLLRREPSDMVMS